jgi:hypothetical protein
LPRAQNSTADDLNRRSPERRAVVAQEDGRHVLAYSGHGVVRRSTCLLMTQSGQRRFCESVWGSRHCYYVFKGPKYQ